MVSASAEWMPQRDLTRVAKVLIAIQLRLLESRQREENEDEPDSGLRAGID
jgi:hypothetical protein